MTRINVVPPDELYDQHLIAEIRELPRMFTYIEQNYNKMVGAPKVYVLGGGHMKFFANKAAYLYNRQVALLDEAKRRNFNINFNIKEFEERYLNLPDSARLDYAPTEDAIELNRKRINERVAAAKEGFQYRYYGKPIDEN